MARKGKERRNQSCLQTLALLKSSCNRGGGKGCLGQRAINLGKNRKEDFRRREEIECRQTSTALKGDIANKETEETCTLKLI